MARLRRWIWANWLECGPGERQSGGAGRRSPTREWMGFVACRLEAGATRLGGRGEELAGVGGGEGGGGVHGGEEEEADGDGEALGDPAQGKAHGELEDGG